MLVRLLWAIALFVGSMTISVNAQQADTARIRESVRAAFAAKLAGGRPMEKNCDLPIPQTPSFDALLKPYRDRQSQIEDGKARFPIHRCEYSEAGFTAEVIMMNPDAEQIARWVVSTCRGSRRVAEGSLAFERCVVSAARQIWLQAAAQYPISGLVVEDIKCDVRKNAQWGFRHGASVRLEGVPVAKNESQPQGVCQSHAKDVPRLCTEARIDDAKVRESLLIAPVVETAREAYARLSNLSRTRVFKGTAGQCPRADGAQPEWLDRSRDGYLAALGNDNYPMLKQWIDSDSELLVSGNRFGCARLDKNLLEDCPSRKKRKTARRASRTR